MRRINDSIVEFWVKDSAFYLTDKVDITLVGRPWHYLSDSMWKNLYKSINHGISIGGGSSMPGSIYEKLCVLTSPRWWGSYDKGKNLSIYINNMYGEEERIKELASVLNAYGLIQKTTANARLYHAPDYTQAFVSSYRGNSLHANVVGLGRAAIRREVYKIFDVDIGARDKMLAIVADRPAFKITYSEPTKYKIELV